MKHLFYTTIILFAAVLSLHAQIIPEENAVYRLVNAGRTNAVMTEDITAHNIYCTDKGGDESYNQLWQFKMNGEAWNIQNVNTGYYVQNQSTVYALFTTATTAKNFYVSENSKVSGKYNIVNTKDGNFGMHCDAAYDVVPWYSGTETTPGGSEWIFEKVELSEEKIAEIRAKYKEFNEVLANKDSVIAAYTKFFEDDLCTVLKSEYASMSDAELEAAMGACNSTLVAAAKKIKNDAWAAREKEFRIHNYEPYSNPDYWATKINIRKYSWLNNPTGIYANTGDVVYVFVGSDIAEGTTLEIDAITAVSPSGTRTTLKKGMNIIPVSREAQSLFILYTADTSGDKVISDFSSIPIHIEGGIVNGYWDKSRHTDADWVDITRNLATHRYMVVKGDYHLFFMSLQHMIADNCCKNTITDAIGWWDNMSKWQQELLGIEEYMPSRFNNKQCAISLTTGYQSATDYRTQYAETYINNLLPYNRMMSNGDNVWGPAHENGDVHQYGINMIACSESSNNLFSNLTLYKLGKYMSRGGKISDLVDCYENNIAFPSRDISYTMRMFWQLYLYYHVAGNNPEFYPTLFKILRENPLTKNSGGLTYGRYDLLHFVEKCCEASGEDMTDFFEAWGFFVPMNRAEFGDYGTYYLTSSQAMIDTTKARIAKYPKKAGAIQFIEDRVRPELRGDGADGYKLVNGVAVGEGGDVGHYTAFSPDSMSLEATGYVYTKAGKTITISKGTGAVGFKIYDADGKLLTFSNYKTIELNDETATKELTIVAVAANAEESVVNNKNNGSEEDQLEALNGALASAESILKFKDRGGKYVGYFYESVLENLIAVTDSSKAAIDNKDQSVHTYGEWATIIDSEINIVLSKEDSRVKIHSGNTYKLNNKLYSGYSMYNSSGNLICESGTKNPKYRTFKFTSTGKENEYYLSNNGNYISSIATSTQAKAATSAQSKALKFTVGDAGESRFYICVTGQSMQSLHCDAGKKVVGWDTKADASQWQLIAVDMNKEIADETALTDLYYKAFAIYQTIVDDSVTVEDNIVFKDGVNVISATLMEDFKAMMVKAEEAQTLVYKKYYDQFPAYIDILTEMIAKVKAGYTLSTGIYGIEAEIGDSVIYDIRGRKIKSVTAPGVYIINGKKVHLGK
jgi:hypothetical protein